MKYFSLIILLFFIFSCEEKNVNPTIDIEQAYNNWKALNINSYTITQIKKCFCIDAGIKAVITVQNEKIINVQDSSGVVQIPQERWQYFKTINQLFQTAIEAKKSNPANFIIEFDEEFKFPVYLYVNPSSKIADDEFEFNTYNLIPQR